MRSLKVKSIGGLLIAGLIAGLSMGTAAGETKEITYAFHGSPTELAAEINAVEAFGKAFPDIKVSILHVVGSYEQKLLTMIAAGTPPDVMVGGSLLNYANEVFLPLDSLIESDLDKSVYLYPEAFFEGFTVEGNVYMLPKSYGGQGVMVYNENLFDEAGLGYPSEPYPSKLTKEAFADLSRKLAKDVDGDGKTDIFGTDPLFYGILLEWWGVYNTGVNLKDGEWVCTWDSPEVIACLTYLYNAMYKEKWALPWGENRMQHFVAGRVAMLTDFGWYLKGELDKIVDFGWDIASRPGKRAPIRGAYSGGVAIARITKHPDAAWELAKFISSDIRAQSAYHTAFPIGVTHEAAEKFMETDHPKYLGYLIYPVEETEVGIPYPPFPARFGEIHAVFWNEILNLYEGNDTPELLGKRVAEQVNNMLEEEREWAE